MTEAPRRVGAAESLVSVIVPVRDNAAGLQELIGRLESQTLPRERFELVVGDDGSRPGSLDGIASHGAWVRVVTGAPQTSYAARNRAAREARGEVLAFCDSDCVPSPTWLEQGLDALEDADVVAGEVTFAAPERPSVWTLLTMDMFLDQEQQVRLSRGVTANLFVRRELFEQVGGFDESLPSGGDYDFVRRAVRMGAKLVYAPSATVEHPTLDERRAFLQKVWSTNRWIAVRHARARERPDLLGVLIFVPVFGVALARWLALRPVWKLQRERIEASGLSPSVRDQLRALAALYFVVAYVAGFARLWGWIEGFRLRSPRS